MNKTPKLKVTGLWSHSFHNSGQTVLQANIGNLTIEIWPNGYKKSDKDPTHIMYVKPKYEKPTTDPSANDMTEPPLFSDTEFPF